MKKLTILFICACLFTVNYAFAQQPKDKMLPVVTITASGTNVNAKVRKAFERSFKDAQNLRWYEVNQNLLVKFIQNDQEHNALFNKRGNIIYDVSYGYEKDMPTAIRQQIKSHYYDYKIMRVFNVKQDSRNIWVINLEDDNNLIFARVEGGDMKEVNRFKKNEYAEGALSKVNKKN